MSVSYSVIIPAYNEEKWLPETLTAVIDVTAGIDLTGEVIVVDNNSRDRTAEVARDYGVRLVYEPVNQIARARNAGAAAAMGKYLIFLDADTIISLTLLQKALQWMESGDCCGGGVLVQPDREMPQIMQNALDLWNTLSLRFRLAAGCFIFCLHEAFDAVGGFSEKVYASEEIWFSRSLQSWGKERNLHFKIISEEMIMTSMRKLDWYSPAQLMLSTLPILLFPPLVCSRKLCSPWYQRPDDK